MGHPSKQVIRNQWCKPLLRFIHDQLGCKLAYLGLPAEEAYDVISWIDYIDYVIAFQCRDYPNPSSIEQSKDALMKLEEKLLELERQNKLSSFSLYDGYIEEILIQGKDTGGQEYVQDRTVTVYSLDFCNSIITPIHYYDENEIRHKAFKSEAIRKLLEIQRAICSSDGEGKFVMFLTVHRNFLGQEDARFWTDQQDRVLTRYLRKLSGLRVIEQEIRKLKAYVFKTLKDQFCANGFTPEFLPPVFYKGAGRNELVLFTIIGQYNRTPASIAPCYQATDTFLNQTFLHINSARFNSRFTTGITENAAINSSVEAFKGSQLFRQLW